ncbi:helix-turn-helix domain-containing protein [Nonomuraea deserti]|uniref:helix-turn-helix domain-containing protein n=1 Tax=Nonomuraea deserti TaxID=1848322 RepID=UPI001C7016E9|nr:helix-turn-helix transcriptional regulator [Nonomuraea deserti]
MDSTKISTREAEVLAAVGGHLSNAQIAGLLRISVRTVESHVAALLRKLDVVDRRALAALAERSRTGRFVGLPTSRTTFVGRTADIAAVEAALDKSRLVTVVGPGGVGKTRPAAAVAERAVSRFPAGGAFVDLVPVRTAAVAGAVGQAVADALDVTEGPTQSVSSRRGTASKTLAPGLRLGRLILPSRLGEPMSRAKMIGDRGSPVFDQLTFEDFVARGERHRRRMRPRYRQLRDTLVGRLAERVPDLVPMGVSASLHVMARLPLSVSSQRGSWASAACGFGACAARISTAPATYRAQ